jgi:hypothetical protein
MPLSWRQGSASIGKSTLQTGQLKGELFLWGDIEPLFWVFLYSPLALFTVGHRDSSHDKGTVALLYGVVGEHPMTGPLPPTLPHLQFPKARTETVTSPSAPG